MIGFAKLERNQQSLGVITQNMMVCTIRRWKSTCLMISGTFDAFIVMHVINLIRSQMY